MCYPRDAMVASHRDPADRLMVRARMPRRLPVNIFPYRGQIPCARILVGLLALKVHIPEGTSVTNNRPTTQVVLEGRVSLNLPQGRFEVQSRPTLAILSRGDSIGDASVREAHAHSTADLPDCTYANARHRVPQSYHKQTEEVPQSYGATTSIFTHLL